MASPSNQVDSVGSSSSSHTEAQSVHKVPTIKDDTTNLSVEGATNIVGVVVANVSLSTPAVLNSTTSNLGGVAISGMGPPMLIDNPLSSAHALPNAHLASSSDPLALPPVNQFIGEATADDSHRPTKDVKAQVPGSHGDEDIEMEDHPDDDSDNSSNVSEGVNLKVRFLGQYTIICLTH